MTLEKKNLVAKVYYMVYSVTLQKGFLCQTKYSSNEIVWLDHLPSPFGTRLEQKQIVEGDSWYSDKR